MSHGLHSEPSGWVLTYRNVPLVSREWKNGSNSSYNCTPFLHSLLTKGKLSASGSRWDSDFSYRGSRVDPESLNPYLVAEFISPKKFTLSVL